MASRYYGTWAAPNPRYQGQGWWVLDADGAVNYAYNKDGNCESGHAMVLGPDRIDVLFGDETREVFRLRLAEGDLLLFLNEDEGTGGMNKRMTTRDICRKPDGTYAPWAPSAVQSR